MNSARAFVSAQATAIRLVVVLLAVAFVLIQTYKTPDLIIWTTVILLVALVSRGPGGYWFAFWTRPQARSIYVTIAFAAFVWVLVVAWIALRDAYSVSRRGSWGRLLVACGVPLLVLGGLVAAIGLETALTAWNDQMALLPWGLSRILGITVYLGIPTELPVYVAALGGVLAVVGAALWLWTRRRDAVPVDA